MNADETQWGELIGAIDVPSGKTRRLELRLKRPDADRYHPTLLIVRHTDDGRAFSIPIQDRHAREFASILDAAIRMLEEGECE